MLSDIKYSCSKSIDLQCLDEACSDRFFAQLWDTDGFFKLYALAAFTLGIISRLTPAERASFYRQIATKPRTKLLSHLSGIEVRFGTLRVLSRTDYRVFGERDWRALLTACTDCAVRRELHKLSRISPVLVHQIEQVPSPIRCAAILDVLNVLDVSGEHWAQFSESLESVPADARQSLIRRARRVRSIGSFWDYLFECTQRTWRAFAFPESFFASSLLRPLETPKQMKREGLKMRNCVGQRVPRVLAGWDAYFHWNGALPATVQLVRGKQGWSVGQVRASGNALVKQEDAAEIVQAALQIGNCTVDERPFDREPFEAGIERVRTHAVKLFPSSAVERIAGELRYINGTSLALDNGSFCIIEGANGYVQFMADSEGKEYLCEIQSHRFVPEIETRLTDSVVSLISDCGFQWPDDKQNFFRWFSGETDDDLRGLAEFALGILNGVFEQSPDDDFSIDTRLAESAN